LSFGWHTAFVYGLINALTLSVRYQDFIGRYNDSASSRQIYLLRLAMEKVTVLPFAYAADVWQSDTGTGSFAPKRMNNLWWSKRYLFALYTHNNVAKNFKWEGTLMCYKLVIFYSSVSDLEFMFTFRMMIARIE